MKRLITLLLMSSCLLGCKESNSQAGDATTVQRDTAKNSKLFQAPSADSVKNGEFIQYYRNGVVKMRGMMKDGRRNGLWKSFYENGSPWSETTFLDGKKDGRTTTWYENEKKRYDGFYTQDRESGKWTFWDEKGNLVTEKDYNKSTGP